MSFFNNLLSKCVSVLTSSHCEVTYLVICKLFFQSKICKSLLCNCALRKELNLRKQNKTKTSVFFFSSESSICMAFIWYTSLHGKFIFYLTSAWLIVFRSMIQSLSEGHSKCLKATYSFYDFS